MGIKWPVLVLFITGGMTAFSPWAVPDVGAFDLSTSSVPRHEILSGGPPKDGIPALTDSQVVSAEAATYLRADDRVLGVAMGNQARAYPIRILNWHEAINDRLGEVPIVVTYCPLCGTGMVFRGEREGRRVLFGVSGLIYNSDVLLYDRDTESLWSQLKMEAITGPRVGERLEWLPAELTTWRAWRAAHPQTDALSLNTGYRRDYGRDPYVKYAATARLMFPVGHEDRRLPAKAWVAGILVNGRPKAYPLDRLPLGRLLEDHVDGETLRITYDAAARAVQVTDAADQLVPLVQAYWFAWSVFYPETLLYGD